MLPPPLISTRVPLALLGVVLAAAVACAPSPVEWTGRQSAARPASDALTLSAEGALVADTMLLLAARVAAPSAPICPGSLRLAGSSGKLFATWWSPRPDSGAMLLAARSADGGTSWTAPAPVDTTDRSVSGCRREPPAIAADSVTGYVHVTYALLAPEGPGLFFSHSMDAGATFHSPVPILYGDRLGRTSVAADGDIVVVGFEDPNSRTPRIGLAMSRTMGHIFEDRIVPVSEDNGTATRPLTAVRGRRISVAWEQRATENATAALTVRVGAVR